MTCTPSPKRARQVPSTLTASGLRAPSWGACCPLHQLWMLPPMVQRLSLPSQHTQHTEMAREQRAAVETCWTAGRMGALGSCCFTSCWGYRAPVHWPQSELLGRPVWLLWVSLSERISFCSLSFVAHLGGCVIHVAAQMSPPRGLASDHWAQSRRPIFNGLVVAIGRTPSSGVFWLVYSYFFCPSYTGVSAPEDGGALADVLTLNP